MILHANRGDGGIIAVQGVTELKFSTLEAAAAAPLERQLGNVVYLDISSTTTRTCSRARL